MSIVQPPSRIVILYDPSNKHIILDTEKYCVFYRYSNLANVRDLICSRQFGQIDLHVPTNFLFEHMRPYIHVYIHTYFVDDMEISHTNETEREKIRDSIRICCEAVGEEFTKCGVMESNNEIFNEGITLVEQLIQMDMNRRNRLLE